MSQKIDPKTISKKKEINLSLEPQMRGIEVKGIVFYIEDDLQTLVAYENGKEKWRNNVIELYGKPQVGKPEIRALTYNNLR